MSASWYDALTAVDHIYLGEGMNAFEPGRVLSKVTTTKVPRAWKGSLNGVNTPVLLEAILTSGVKYKA